MSKKKKKKCNIGTKVRNHLGEEKHGRGISDIVMAQTFKCSNDHID